MILQCQLLHEIVARMTAMVEMVMGKTVVEMVGVVGLEVALAMVVVVTAGMVKTVVVVVGG